MFTVLDVFSVEFQDFPYTKLTMPIMQIDIRLSERMAMF